MFVHIFALYVGGGGHQRISDESQIAIAVKSRDLEHLGDNPRNLIILAFSFGVPERRSCDNSVTNPLFLTSRRPASE